MELNNSFNNKLIEKLKGEDIKPRPRWQFVVRHLSFWLGGTLALVISSLSASVMIYFFSFDELAFYGSLGKQAAGAWFLVFPYFWVIFLAIFVLIISYNIKKIGKSYRYPVWLIIIVSVLSSLILGAGFFALGSGEKIDNLLGRRAPFYDKILNPRVDFWSHPESGRLAGLVISHPQDGSFALVDRDRQEWQVSFSERENHFAWLDDLLGKPVMISGRRGSNHSFAAERISPMHPGNGFFNERNRERLAPPPPPPMDLIVLWAKYPELKDDFVANLLENQTSTREIISHEPGFAVWLKSLNLDQNTLKTLGL